MKEKSMEKGRACAGESAITKNKEVKTFEIIGMTKKDLIALDPAKIDRLLTKEEVIYIAEILDSFWKYDYEALEKGKPGMHAILKSGFHSDAFFISRIMLQYLNIRQIFARQLMFRFDQLKVAKPDWVAGIPDGATELGRNVAQIMGVKNAEMKKEDGKIVLISSIGPDETLLGIEDFVTRGTGFTEATLDILSKQPKVKFLPYMGVILNRGSLKEIKVEGIGPLQIVSVADYQIQDWEPTKCPLCERGSKPIKPKATDKNWDLITTSQQ